MMMMECGDILGDGMLGDDFDLPACKGSPSSAIDFLTLEGDGFWDPMTGDSLSPSLSLSPPLGSPRSTDDFESLITSSNSIQEAMMSPAVPVVQPVVRSSLQVQQQQQQQRDQAQRQDSLHMQSQQLQQVQQQLQLHTTKSAARVAMGTVKDTHLNQQHRTQAVTSGTKAAATNANTPTVTRKTEDHANPFKTCHLCGTARQSNHNRLVRCADRDSSRSAWCPFVCHQKCIERKVAGLVVDFVDDDGTGMYKTEDGTFPFRCTVCTNLCTCDIGRGESVMCYAGKKRNAADNKTAAGVDGKGEATGGKTPTGKDRRKSSVSISSAGGLTPTSSPKGSQVASLHHMPASTPSGSAATVVNAGGGTAAQQNKVRKTSMSLMAAPYTPKPYAAKHMGLNGAAGLKAGSTSSFDQLPVEVIVRIFGHVDGLHWGQFALVCKKWRCIVDMNRPGLKYVSRPDRPSTLLTMASRAGCRLQTLEFADCHELTESSFHQLVRACPGIRHLSLARCLQVKDSWLTTIMQLKRLQTLDLTDCELSGAGLSEVGLQCPGLDNLTVSSTARRWFTEAHALELIRFFPHLKQLGAAHQLDDGCLRVLSQGLPFLERIDLSDCADVSSDGVIFLIQRCSYLDTLLLRNCPRVTDEALAVIGQTCKELVRLDVSACPSLSPGGLVAIAKGCPQLRHLQLSGCADGSSVSDEVLSLLVQNCLRLEELDLNDCTMLTDAGVGAVATRSAHLRRLNLSGCWGITDDVLEALGACKELADLTVSNCTLITPRGIKGVTGGKAPLRRLDLSGCLVPESALAELVCKCPTLTSVVVTENGRKQVWAGNPNGPKAAAPLSGAAAEQV